MELEDLFYYDITAPSGLRRKTDWRCGKDGHFVREKAGSPTGSRDGKGYYRVSIKGKDHAAHIVIWRLHNGDIPFGYCIDHIDGNGLNNDINNLRLVSHKENMQNTKIRSHNKTGHTGVTEVPTIGGYGKFLARWRSIDGIECSKTFSIKKYGREDALLLAIDYRAKMIAELNAQGACYTERHGKPKEEVNG
jgi:hypothetical protein